MLESYVIARDRFLVPNGKMFPSVGRIHMAPFSDEYLYVEIANKALFWQQQNYYGVDLTALHGTAFHGYFSQPVVDAFDPRLLVAPAISHVIDFSTVKEEDLYEIKIPLKFTASVGTRIQGLACGLMVIYGRVALTRIGATNHWYQLRCVLSQPIYVMPGQEITGHLHMIAHSAQSYTINLTMSDASHKPSLLSFAQQQRYPIPPGQGMGEVICRQIIPLPLGKPTVRRLLPGRPPAKRKALLLLQDVIFFFNALVAFTFGPSIKMWGPGAEQGGILQTSSCRLDLKEPYYRMSQPQAYSSSQDQQPNQLLQSQDLQLSSLDEDGSDFIQQPINDSGVQIH
ncbi:probable histone-arginine methyltransferase 1.3 [Tanacetum coccineum]